MGLGNCPAACIRGQPDALLAMYVNRRAGACSRLKPASDIEIMLSLLYNQFDQLEFDRGTKNEEVNKRSRNNTD